MIRDKIYNRNKLYVVFHWFVHFLLAYLLAYLSVFRFTGNFLPFTVIGFNFMGTQQSLPVLDYFIIYLATFLIDLDHLKVFRKYGFRGIFVFARKRIQYPLHNFFVFGVFATLSAVFSIDGLRLVGIIFLAPVIHMIWDMLEDVLIFKTSYRKWERTWGVDTKELENLWKEALDGSKSESNP